MNWLCRGDPRLLAIGSGSWVSRKYSVEAGTDEGKLKHECVYVFLPNIT